MGMDAVRLRRVPFFAECQALGEESFRQVPFFAECLALGEAFFFAECWLC